MIKIHLDLETPRGKIDKVIEAPDLKLALRIARRRLRTSGTSIRYAHQAVVVDEDGTEMLSIVNNSQIPGADPLTGYRWLEYTQKRNKPKETSVKKGKSDE